MATGYRLQVPGGDRGARPHRDRRRQGRVRMCFQISSGCGIPGTAQRPGPRAGTRPHSALEAGRVWGPVTSGP